ncbi:putative lipid-transfer protein DIR1 [Helianthus annuus]|nr:putative lipid-transfer protein DIR1 [Helianthus annuus]
MEGLMKNMCLLGLLLALVIAGEVNGARECGRANPDMEAFKLAYCASAAQNKNASVSGSCCDAVQKLGQNPKCLCAVMLSNTAKASYGSFTYEPLLHIPTLMVGFD